MTRKKKVVEAAAPVEVKKAPAPVSKKQVSPKKPTAAPKQESVPAPPSPKAEEERLRAISNLAVLGERSLNNAGKLLAEASQINMIGTRYDHNDSSGKPSGKSALVFAYTSTPEQIQRVEKAISEALQSM